MFLVQNKTDCLKKSGAPYVQPHNILIYYTTLSIITNWERQGESERERERERHTQRKTPNCQLQKTDSMEIDVVIKNDTDKKF